MLVLAQPESTAQRGLHQGVEVDRTPQSGRGFHIGVGRAVRADEFGRPHVVGLLRPIQRGTGAGCGVPRGHRLGAGDQRDVGLPVGDRLRDGVEQALWRVAAETHGLQRPLRSGTEFGGDQRAEIRVRPADRSSGRDQVGGSQQPIAGAAVGASAAQGFGGEFDRTGQARLAAPVHDLPCPDQHGRPWIHSRWQHCSSDDLAGRRRTGRRSYRQH